MRIVILTLIALTGGGSALAQSVPSHWESGRTDANGQWRPGHRVYETPRGMHHLLKGSLAPKLTASEQHARWHREHRQADERKASGLFTSAPL